MTNYNARSPSSGRRSRPHPQRQTRLDLRLQGAGDQIFQVPGGQVGFIRFNDVITPLDDPNVRCALAWSVDRETIAKQVDSGYGAVAKSMFPLLTWTTTRMRAPSGSTDEGQGLPIEELRSKRIKRYATHQGRRSRRRSDRDHLDDGAGQHRHPSDGPARRAVRPRCDGAKGRLPHRGLYFTNDTPDPDELSGALDYAVADALDTNFHDEAIHQLLVQGRAELDTSKRADIYSQVQKADSEQCVTIYTIDQPRLYAGAPAIQGYGLNAQGSTASKTSGRLRSLRCVQERRLTASLLVDSA